MTEGSDYLYYEHAYHTGGVVTGLTNSEVTVVATKRCLFIVPQREVSLGVLSVNVKTHFPKDEKLTIPLMVSRLVGSCDSVEALEAALSELVAPIAIEGLTKLSVWMLFRQVRFKAATGATQVLALKGRGNHERFKAFYADALR
jgi:hypothetical protein